MAARRRRHHHVCDRSRTREGNRLHRQLPLHPAYQTKFEFLLGKQLPYVAVAIVNFVFLLVTAIFVFGVPIKGPFLTLLIGTVASERSFKSGQRHDNCGRRRLNSRLIC